MSDTPKKTAAELEAWILDQLAASLRVQASEIDVRANFDQLGVDSVNALRLVGELEELLGRDLPDSLLFDYPSISELAAYLAS